MVRDLVEVSVRLVKEEKAKEVEIKAKERVESRLIPAIIKKRREAYPDMSDSQMKAFVEQELAEGKLDDLIIEIDLPEQPKPQMLGNGAAMEINITDLMGGVFGGGKPKMKTKQISVADAYKLLLEFEEENLIDKDNVNAEAIRRAENEGIIFIDEIDKIATSGNTQGHDVSRDGVQRDILPIVEGSTVNTKYGQVKTDFMLFIAAGAFHVSSVSDLIPELQGRFPVSVKLDSLTEEDFVKILTQPDNAILMQYTELLKVDNVRLKFTQEAIEQIAKIAAAENENQEDIGARRLHTLMENLLDDISYNAGSLETELEIVIDRNYVLEHLAGAIKNLNLRKYIL